MLARCRSIGGIVLRLASNVVKMEACVHTDCDAVQAELDTPFCIAHCCNVLHCDRPRRSGKRTCDIHKDVDHG